MSDNLPLRECFVCSQPHWVNGRKVPAVTGPQPYPCEHQEMEFQLWRSIRRWPGRETESAFGSKF